MHVAPKSLRLQIGLFGRTNVGKSSFLNMVAGQDIAITSSRAGTTTDVVEKVMELLPVGPVVFLDTAGLDDTSELSFLRIKNTMKIFKRADIAVLITEPNNFGSYEKKIFLEAQRHKIPVIAVVNKIDLKKCDEAFLNELKRFCKNIVLVSSVEEENKDKYITNFKKYLLELIPDDYHMPLSILKDLISKEELCLLIVPIDIEAPKGRLILPQVQTIRCALDVHGAALVVKESEYLATLRKLKKLPDLVVCDSQVVKKMAEISPPKVKLTTFSILFARSKGDLIEEAKGLAVIERLKENDKILIAEACSHHPLEVDIGRIQIPRHLKRYTGLNLQIDVASGRCFPEDVSSYRLIIHCGACMLTGREMLLRVEMAKEIGVPITNYGLCISYLEGVLNRVLKHFPEALKALKGEQRCMLKPRKILSAVS